MTSAHGLTGRYAPWSRILDLILEEVQRLPIQMVGYTAWDL